MQRQKTAKAEVKCVNWDRWFIGKWFQSQLKLRVVKSKDGSTVRYVSTVWYASTIAKKYDTVRLFCNGTGTVRFKNWAEVRYAGTVRLKVRGT